MRRVYRLGCAAMLLSFVACLTVPTNVRADNTENYAFSGTLATPFNGSDSVTGQFTYDFTSGDVTGFNFTTPYSDVTPEYFIVQVFDVTCGPPAIGCSDGTSPIEGSAVFLQFLGPGFFGTNEMDLFLQGSLSASESSPIYPELISEYFKIADYSELSCDSHTLAPDPLPLDCSGASQVTDDFFTSGEAVPTPEPSHTQLLCVGLLLLMVATQLKKHAKSPHPLE
jgi:hypothetical protein